MTAPTRLPTEYRRVLEKIVHRINRFDVIEIDVNLNLSRSRFDDLESHCKKVRISKIRRAYNYHWKTRIRVDQPTKKCIQLLNNILREAKCEVSLLYIEVVLDLITNEKNESHALGKFLQSSMIVKGKRCEIKLEKNTTYYDRRGKKFVPLIYTDRASKTTGERKGKGCCHLEHRFRGSAKLAMIGISSLEDLSKFDFNSYWRQAIHLRTLIAKTEIAKFLEDESSDLSATALRNRTNEYLSDFTSPMGTLLLQNIKVSDGDMFRKITTELDAIPLIEGLFGKDA